MLLIFAQAPQVLQQFLFILELKNLKSTSMSSRGEWCQAWLKGFSEGLFPR